ncbi:sensor domain-containing protein [Mycobacterium sp. DL99]|uniref:sensor domain-containing protein n=1 Tax=Mycobacterium sp. DL99 TaxID=2528957 RepID=UPI00336BF575
MARRSFRRHHRQVAQILEVSRRCAGQVTLKFNDGSRTVLYEIGPTTRATRDPSITMVSSTMDGSSKFLHVRVVAAKAKVVVDAQVFGGNLGDSGESIAAEILLRIPA